MNTDDLDPDAYRRWWETEGRGDLTTCPCGQPAGDLTLDSSGIAPPRTVGASRPGFCPRHMGMAAGREDFATAILNGTFSERDLTDTEAETAQRLADGRPRFDA